MSGSEAGLRPATSISGGIHGLSACMELKSMSHWSRKIGNPRAEKVLQHRSRQNKPAVRCEYPDDVGAPCQQWHSAGADRQGTLTITGSNVRLGTEMPVALSRFFI
jgi:hypothetical protein